MQIKANMANSVNNERLSLVGKEGFDLSFGLYSQEAQVIGNIPGYWVYLNACEDVTNGQNSSQHITSGFGFLQVWT